MGVSHSSNKIVEKSVKRLDRFSETVIIKKQKVRITSSSNPPSSVTQSLPSVSDIFIEFLKLDKRLKPSKDYEIEPTGRQLFIHVNDIKLKMPVFQALLVLQEIYNSERGHEITYSADDRHKQYTFIDIILKTKVMKRCLDILRVNGDFTESRDDFRQRLYEIWFHLWGNHRDTCAFEHVFVGERIGHVNGFHNWVQYYRQQQKGNIRNYRQIWRNNQNASKDSLIVAMSFDWLGQHKRVDSMFIGTTPAFEMAIYTYLFFSVHEQKSITPVHLGDHDFEIHMIKNGDRIITTYPEVVD